LVERTNGSIPNRPRSRLRAAGAILFGVIAASSTFSRAGDTWPAWRGPTGQGLSDEKDLPLTWGGAKNENVLWKTALPGTDAQARQDHNQSSPIVWKDRVFVQMCYWPKDAGQSAYAEHHVACYSAADGSVKWDVKVQPGPWMLTDLRGGYCAPTPCTDGQRIYALFGSSELVALDFDGHVVWRKEITPFAWDVAIGTSPILTRDAVLVLVDGNKPALSRLVAFDPATGEIKWEQKRPEANFDHTTPLLVEINGQQQLLVGSSGAVQGLDANGGAEIWHAGNPGDVPTPAYGGGFVYCESGRGGPGICIDPTGKGDVTKTNVKWTSPKVPEGFCSPTIAGGYVYRIHSPGVLRCLELATGKIVFDKRLPQGAEAAASPIKTADDRLYFASGGVSVVLPVGPTSEPIATNDLADGSSASPAVANGCLYIKGSRYLYCIGKPRSAP
jgi:outer membrane protein assembly factor BamB